MIHPLLQDNNIRIVRKRGVQFAYRMLRWKPCNCGGPTMQQTPLFPNGINKIAVVAILQFMIGETTNRYLWRDGTIDHAYTGPHITEHPHADI